MHYKLESISYFTWFSNYLTFGTFIVYRSDNDILVMFGTLRQFLELGISMLHNVSSLEEIRRVLLHKNRVVTQLHLHWSATSELAQPAQLLFYNLISINL